MAEAEDTERSATLPLWPQLEQILRPYIFDREEPLGQLLFPSPRSVQEAMVTDLRKAFDAAALPAGFVKGTIRTKLLRHTYCSARLQTLDGGAPVSEFTVAKEMGHGGFNLVRNIYGHLGRIRHRAEVVEYHVEQYRKLLTQRLQRLHGVRGCTSGEDEQGIHQGYTGGRGRTCRPNAYRANAALITARPLNLLRIGTTSGEAMSLLDYLRKACEPLPSEASLTLPVGWLRAELEGSGAAASQPQPSHPQADLTVDEVAEIVHREPGTVRGWIRNGLNGIRLAAYHFTAKEYRITRVALDDFLDAERRRATEPKPVARQPGSDDLGRWRTARGRQVGRKLSSRRLPP